MNGWYRETIAIREIRDRKLYKDAPGETEEQRRLRLDELHRLEQFIPYKRDEDDWLREAVSIFDDNPEAKTATIALKEIRDRKLYTKEVASFEEFVRLRFPTLAFEDAVRCIEVLEFMMINELGSKPKPAKLLADVYFIQAGDSGPIKIGIARNAKKRRGNLQTSHSETLVIRAVIPNGGEIKEKELHSLFAPFHIKGEWFQPSEQVLDYIKELAIPTLT